MRCSPLLCGVGLALLTAGPAWADEAEPFAFGYESEMFVLGGISGGGSFGSAGGGGFVGYELSAVWLNQAAWGGFFGDIGYDFGHSAATLVVGPELGYGILGLDGGAAFRFGFADEVEVGVQARLLLALTTFSIFGRYGFWPDSVGGQHIGQVGVLIKMPFWNSSDIPEVAR